MYKRFPYSDTQEVFRIHNCPDSQGDLTKESRLLYSNTIVSDEYKRNLYFPQESIKNETGLDEN